MPRLPWIPAALILAATVAPALASEVAARVPEAPRPPVYRFARAPQQSMVAGSQVYVVDDLRVSDDQFHYGVFWYVYRDHAWFRARHWNGPYATIAPREVPRAIITVPPGRWKHQPSVAPGSATRRNAPAWVAEKERRIHGER